jgi:hypothetical protein
MINIEIPQGVKVYNYPLFPRVFRVCVLYEQKTSSKDYNYVTLSDIYRFLD